ncbi:hypothetical protein GCM10008018_16950 [Paenibacillus marchantiophytorum]|uniref:Uncharacterized protein n=1 Tax=Paenibacillus marchantiophytorum TaxID=1619310 RepID=A0ABQ2BS98_9BACL|nr:hypothetical protein GCM10008018_16950 [Paenibacillus marchantiophytorum]
MLSNDIKLKGLLRKRRTALSFVQLLAHQWGEGITLEAEEIPGEDAYPQKMNNGSGWREPETENIGGNINETNDKENLSSYGLRCNDTKLNGL